MAIQFQVDKLDGVDEALKSLYKETDGGFVLDVDGAVPQSKFAEVNQKAVDAATEAARRRKTLERVTGKLGLETADGLDDALDALIAGKGGKKDADQEAVIAQIKAASTAKETELLGRLKAIQMDGAAAQSQAALMAAGFSDKVAKMLATSNLNRVQLDDDGKIRIMSEKGTPLAGSGADGFATFGDLAKELAAAMPELLTDTGKGGGGKPPASGNGNPKTKTVTRSQFDSMSHSERATFAKEGGKVVDG